MERNRRAVEWELTNPLIRPESRLPELIHAAAYGSHSLGMPLQCPAERIPLVTSDELRSYLKQYYCG